MNSYAGDVIVLNGLGILYKTAQHILLLADAPMQATGTCVWNGGTAIVNGWLNLKVDGHCDISASPAHTLQHYAAGLGMESPLAGMMTAASMNSLRYALTGDDATVLACIVTAGIENARRAGDTADEQLQPGTINIALVCNRHFSPAAAIEALLIATEAKTAACYDLNISSPVSHQIATGTGTDSICLLSALSLDEQNSVEYCGKHTRLGEWLGSAAYEAVYGSLAACVGLRGGNPD